MRCAMPSTMAVLPTPGLADEHRVVLGAARQHLDGAADLLVAADDRVELALAGQLGEVARVLLERLVLALGFSSVTRCVPRTSVSALQQRVVVTPASLSAREAAPKSLADERQQEVLGRGVLVLELLRLLGRLLEQLGQPAADVDVGARAPHLGLRVERALGGLATCAGVDPDLAQERAREPVLLVEQRQQQVLRRQLLVPAAPGQLMRGLDRLSGLDGQLVEPHGTAKLVSTAAGPTSAAAHEPYRRPVSEVDSGRCRIWFWPGSTGRSGSRS